MASSLEVPKLIRVAQDSGAEELVLSNISFKNAPVSSEPKPDNGRIRYVAITSSKYPDAWNWASLNVDAIENVHIEKCDFRHHTLSGGFLSSIAGRKLISLTISECQLRTIEREAFQRLITLRILSLRNNHLTNLDAYAFGNATLPALWSIDLSRNTLAHLDKSLFDRLPALTHINLNGNHMNQLDGLDTVWYTLRELQISDNPLLCDTICWTLHKTSAPQLFYYATCKFYGFSRPLMSEQVRGHCRRYATSTMSNYFTSITTSSTEVTRSGRWRPHWPNHRNHVDMLINNTANGINFLRNATIR